MPRRPYEKEYTHEPQYEEYDKSKEYEKSKKCEKPEKEEKCAKYFDFSSIVNITQSNEVTTGNGGDSNEANSTAAQAVADDAATATVSVNAADDLVDKTAPAGTVNNGENAADELRVEQNGKPPVEPIKANNTSISSAGSGGNANVNNIAEVDITQMIIIPPCCGPYDGPPPQYQIGLNGKKLDITMDDQGNTFVNGKKMDIEKLDDGTNVFLFKNHVMKKNGETGV